MKNLTLSILAIFAIFISATSTYAQSTPNYRSDNTVLLKQSETVNKDFFASGEDVRVYGTVNGDVYVAGGRVRIDGTVNGDVLAAGGTVTISGSVSQDVRVVGGAVDITGRVGQNVSVIGGTATLASSADVAGNVLAIAGTTLIDTPIGGNLTSLSQNLTLAKSILKDADVLSENIDVMDGATVGGNLTYASMKPANLNESQVTGKVTEVAWPVHEEKKSSQPTPDKGALAGMFTFMTVLWLIADSLFGLLLVYLLPRFTHNMSEMIQNKPLQSIGLGLICLIVIPIAAMILLFTLVGFPLAIITLFAYALGIYISQFFVMFWLGWFVSGKLNRKWHDGFTFLFGMILYNVLKFIPVVGLFFQLFVLLLGFGALALTKNELVKTLRAKKLL